MRGARGDEEELVRLEDRLVYDRAGMERMLGQIQMEGVHCGRMMRGER